MRTRNKTTDDLKAGFINKPKKLPVLTIPVIGDCYVDFRLKELRTVKNAGMTISFENMTDGTKALVRAIRAEHGPNQYMKELDS